jgi:hypothetical protein
LGSAVPGIAQDASKNYNKIETEKFNNKNGVYMNSRPAKAVFVLYLFCSAHILFGQQHKSVPLDHEAYYLIEHAVMRGICAAPVSARPWSEYTVTGKLREILNSEGGLSRMELDMVKAALERFERKPGLDWNRGAYYLKAPLSTSYYTFEGGASLDTSFSVNTKNKSSLGTADMLDLYFGGDMGAALSYDFHFRAGTFYLPREAGSNEVAAYFPYTIWGTWDGVVFNPITGENFRGWPEKWSFGYELISEIDASFLDNRLQFRFGRIHRDWGPEENGASLFLNSHARPFLAVEGNFVFLDWLKFSSLTGVLEYIPKTNEMKWDAITFQNAFSAGLLEFDLGKYVHIDVGSSVIWPKRFELGYIYPANSNLIYQNVIGDFDNVAFFGDIEGRLPGIGKIWLSGFLDEAQPKNFGTFFTLDRNMYALQAGAKALVSWLPFAAVTLRYTKVEPYCYTHPKTNVPWYNDPNEFADLGELTDADRDKSLGMEEGYINTGASLGYYLPPNSDELLLRFESMIAPGARAFMQYQLMRHGVEYGPGAVDGSSLHTIDHVYDENSRKFFLRDGVYQWDHVIKLGGAYSLKRHGIPVSIFADTGVVITRFTASDAGPGQEGSYGPVDNDIYPAGTGFIFTIGVKVYP